MKTGAFVNFTAASWRGPHWRRWLDRQVAATIASGVRYCMFNRPYRATTRPRGGHVPAMLTTLLDPERLMALIEAAKTLRDHKVKVDLFVGSRWWAFHDAVGYTGGKANYPGNTYGFDPNIPHERIAWHVQSDVWADTGVGWVFDVGSSDWGDYANLGWIDRLSRYDKRFTFGVEPLVDWHTSRPKYTHLRQYCRAIWIHNKWLKHGIDIQIPRGVDAWYVLHASDVAAMGFDNAADLQADLARRGFGRLVNPTNLPAQEAKR
jgi:hypothetical protein